MRSGMVSKNSGVPEMVDRRILRLDELTVRVIYFYVFKLSGVYPAYACPPEEAAYNLRTAERARAS